MIQFVKSDICPNPSNPQEQLVCISRVLKQVYHLDYREGSDMDDRPEIIIDDITTAKGKQVPQEEMSQVFEEVRDHYNKRGKSCSNTFDWWQTPPPTD